jgi:prephenate dehydrogenase
VGLSKEEIIVSGSALDHTRAAIERNYDQAYTNAFECTYARAQNHDRAHTTYSRVLHIALAAVANLLAPWDIGAVT